MKHESPSYLDGIPKKKIRAFRESASNYYVDHGRKDLPWRQTKVPWQVLLAEVLLRKTTAVQALAVYDQVKDLTPEVLRDFPVEELEKMLEPLGIYRERARLLKLIGEKVVQEGIERLSDWDFLVSLPGIGRYAASMVLSTIFDEQRPGLDRNMIRILERVFSIRSDKSRPHTDRYLWEAAVALAPEKNTAAYNWGILDLSAAFCKPRNPLCQDCSLNNLCDYVLVIEGIE